MWVPNHPPMETLRLNSSGRRTKQFDSSNYRIVLMDKTLTPFAHFYI